MKIGNRELEFPAIVELNFAHLIDGIKKQEKKSNGLQSKYYAEVAKVIDENPWLSENISRKKYNDNKALIKELIEVMFPSVLGLNELKMFTMPWDFRPLHQTERMKAVHDAAGKGFDLNFSDLDDDMLYIAACTYVLAKKYNMIIPYSRPYVFDIPNKNTGKTISYRMTINGDYMDLESTDKSIEITQEMFHELIDNYNNIELWKKYFPKDSWIFKGFLLISLVDVNNDTIISRITNSLLSTDKSGFLALQSYISEFLDKEILLSFVGLKGDQFMQAKNKDLNSLLMGDADIATCGEVLCSYSYQELIINQNPIAVPDVDSFAKKSDSPIAQNLHKTGVKSYYATPITYDGVSMGIMELGSMEKGVLNSTISFKIQEIIPIISMAAKRYDEEMNNRIEAIIQEECTSIHPSVKWRFEMEAMKHIDAIEDGHSEHHFDDLVFSDVFPLYGQLDIRSSSTIRNEAIKSDLLTQLLAAKEILLKAKKIKNLPIYSELIFILDSFKIELKDGMISSSEQSILRFLNKELGPILKELASQNPKLKKAFDHYESLLHPDFRFVYDERKAFDDSVNMINRTLAQFIDDKQHEAQEMFPHYFERYKTDGLEFNMYIGESISPNQGFHSMMVKNLRLWQLIVMVEMERKNKEVQQKCKKPLEVASLILAFNNSLSIQFRMDEKRFDVEGAYNARYEIIKKRIDKAHIKGTTERITEPGKMVVVYSGLDEETEYKRFFTFLAAKGYVKKEDFEIVQLEDLQGVSGLKAIRASVVYSEDENKGDIGLDEIMAEIEEQNKSKA